MKKIFTWVLVVAGATVLVGCEKKAEVEQVESLPEMVMDVNAIASPDDSLTIVDNEAEMSGASGAVSATDAMVPAPAEMAAVPTGKFENVSTADIQKALKNAGMYNGTVDGVYGPKTKKAVKEFQTQNNLKADGKVGPKTWKKLEPHLYASSQSAAMPAGN